MIAGVRCALALLALACTESAVAACETLLTGTTVANLTVEVRGRERVSRDIPLPASADAVVFAAEDGIDVTLEIARAGHVMARADNPIARTGVQRAILAGGEAAPYVLTLVGKEHANARGRVDVRVLLMSAASARDACVVAQRRLAAADAAYAAAQSSSGGSPADASSSYEAALATYAAAAADLASQGPSPLLARTQQAQAELLDDGVRDWSGASERASNAMQTYAALGDDFGKARAQFLRAQAEIELAVKPRTPAAAAGASSTAVAFAKVRAELQAVADFHARRDEPYYEAMALNNIGVAYHMEGRYDDALRAYRRTLPLYEQLGETPGQAAVLQNISLVEFELGRLSDSVPHYAQVLELLARDDDPSLYASILCNSALANWASGHYDVALRQLGEALPIVRNAGDKFWEAVALNNTGVVYDALGDRTRALDFYRQALTLRTVELDSRGRVSSLRTIANILRDQGRPDEAWHMHQEALALASGSAKKRVLVQIGRDQIALGREEEAVRQVQPVIDLREPGDDVVRARALVVRGQARAAAHDYAAAQADFNAALRSFRRYEQAEDELDTWVQLARVMRARGAPDDALAALDEALALAEEVRAQSANPELRATLLQPLRPAFDLKIALLAERYFADPARPDERIARLALTTAERARARALEDFARLDLSAPGVPPNWAARRL
jgi:tetratricopeptide (TPR) repeat protein